MKDNTKEKMLLVECSRVFQYHYKQYIIPLFLYNMEGGGGGRLHYSKILCKYGLQFSLALQCPVIALSNVQGTKA